MASWLVDHATACGAVVRPITSPYRGPADHQSQLRVPAKRSATYSPGSLIKTSPLTGSDTPPGGSLIICGSPATCGWKKQTSWNIV